MNGEKESNLTQVAVVVAAAPTHTISGHPENASRLQAVTDLLTEHQMWARLHVLTAVPATITQVERVHAPAVLATLRQVGMLDPDTYVTPSTYKDALLAAGGACQIVDRVMAQGGAGVALIRPPGHHANATRSGGFCLLNNVAIATRQVQATHPGARVMIVDLDVHHGNGTQDIFYQDDTVLFVSAHRHDRRFYPGSGGLSEMGQGRGAGFTVNIPLPPRVGDAGYAQLMAEIIVPQGRAFQPDIVLVSLGFDAHWQDPLGQAGLSLTGYAHLVTALSELAQICCDGRIAFFLEGGYHLDALKYGVLNLLQSLSGDDTIIDPLGAMGMVETKIDTLLREVQELHLRN